MSTLITHPKWRWLTSLVAIFVLTVTTFLFSNAFGRQRKVSGDSAVQTRTATTLAATGFTFSPPAELLRTLSPAFFQQGGEPEIKVDVFGNTYVTAIQGVPGGVDLWKSTDRGTSFVYLGQPDGAQDKCGPSGPAPTPVPCPGGLGGGDDQIDVSPGGYLYISSLWLGNVTMSTSYDGGTGGVVPGQKWEVHPAAAGLPSDDRQWVAAYGPSTVYLAYANAQAISPPGVVGLFVTKSIDGGKTFSAPTPITSPTALDSVNVEGNLVVDPYNGNLYTAYLLNASLNAIQVARSTDGGATWTSITAYPGPAGTSNRGVFPILAIDRGGNLHLVFTRVEASGACHIWMTSSANPAAATPTWLPAVQVDSGSGNTTTAVEPWVVAGSPGRVDIAWLGSTAVNPDVTSNWQLFFAQTTNALSGSPLFNQVQVTTNPVHSGSICFNGSGCASAMTPHGEPGNRDMAEYFTMTLDGDGNANIAFPDSVNNCDATVCVTNAWFTKQTGGTSAYTPQPAPAPATFAPNIVIGSPGGEPGLKVDSHNCMFATTPGNPWVWKSVNNGASFLPPVNPVAGRARSAGDEDILPVPQANGSRPDLLYFADLGGLVLINIAESTDGGATWFPPGAMGAAGQLDVSSDRQWIAYDRGVPSATDLTVYEMDHEAAAEAIRFSALTNDGAWSPPASGITASEMILPPDSTFPNTNPGPVFVDPITHTVYGVFTASTIRTNQANPPFGKLPNVWIAAGPAPTAAGAPPGPFVNHPAFKGVHDSPTAPSPAPTVPPGAVTYGSNTANDFPGAAIDAGGNIYVVWAMNNARTNEYMVWMATSHDHGQNFYGPFQISQGPGAAVMPWIAAGDAGRIDLVYYATTTPVDPNVAPNTVEWNAFFAQSLNANSREPAFTISPVSHHVMHNGPICNQGILCGTGTRTLADFFQVAIGPDGLANIAYADNGPVPLPPGNPDLSTSGTHAEFARQNDGPIAKANPSGVTCLPGAPIPISVVSRKTHGTVGTFDVNLPFIAHGIECRNGQPGANQHKVVFTFPVPVTVVSASISSNNGTVNSTTVSGSTVTVNLTAASGPQKIVIKLTGVDDGAGNSGDISWPMDILLADVNASGGVDSGDVLLLQKQNGQALPPSGSADFRRDINLNGFIDSGDVLSGQKHNPSVLPP